MRALEESFWKRPIAWISLFYCLGLLPTIAKSLSIHSWLLAVVTFSCTLLAWKFRVFAWAFLALGFLFLGAARFHQVCKEANANTFTEILQSPHPLVRVRGRIETRELEMDNPGFYRFELKLDSLVGKKRLLPLQGRLRCFIQGESFNFKLGSRVEILGLLRAIPPPTNPGESNRQSKAELKQTLASLQSNIENISSLEEPQFSIQEEIFRARANLLNSLQKRLSPEEVNFAAPLLLGIWPSPSEENEVFLRTGTIHLLAVSGLQVVLIFAPLFHFLLKKQLNRGLLLAFLFPALLFYAFLTGFQPPVLRASVMLLLHFSAVIFRRAPDSFSVLGASALLVGTLQPSEVGTVSFQLSFLAVFGMAVFIKPITARLQSIFPLEKKWLKNLLVSLAISIAAFFSTLPIVFFAFGTICLVSIPATLLLTPLIPPLMILGYLICWAPETLAAWLVLLFHLLTKIVYALLHVIDALPGTPWFAPQLSLLGVTATCLGFLGLLEGKWFRTSCSILFLGILLCLWPHSREAGLQIDFLDVAHGNAIVIRTPDEKILLFDAGSMEKKNVGRSVVLPFFRNQGISKVELFVLSHPDFDHYSALPTLDSLPGIEEFICGNQVSKHIHPLPKAKITELSGKLERKYGESLVTILRPNVSSSASENDSSLCMKIEYAGRSVLLCGDIEEEGTRALIESEENLNASVILVPHHGLPNEELPEFLELVRPEQLILSCGKRFREEGEVSSFWNGPFLSTKNEGCIQLRISPKGELRFKRFKKGEE